MAQCIEFVSPTQGNEGVEVPQDEGPFKVDSAGAVSEEDKMLLDCLEHVSCRKVCCLLINYFTRLTFAFL
jgi:hypothetical protein